SRIVIAPTEPESIYAIIHTVRTGATMIYKSTNAGRTWQPTAHGLPPSCCWDSEDALAIDPADPPTLYTAVGGTVLATTNGGATWRLTANGLPAKAVTSLAADPRRPGTLYAGVRVPQRFSAKSGPLRKPIGGVYKTTDGGQTWIEVWSGSGIDKVAVDPK